LVRRKNCGAIASRDEDKNSSPLYICQKMLSPIERPIAGADFRSAELNYLLSNKFSESNEKSTSGCGRYRITIDSSCADETD
jgi:hypothetical protein